MGTAMGALISNKGVEVSLWARRDKVRNDITQNHVNSEYLPGVKLQPNLQCTTNLSDALKDIDVLVLAIPSHALTEILERIRETIVIRGINVNFISLSVIKGTIHPLGRIFASDEIRRIIKNDVAVLAGPTFASEIAQKKPTVVTLASKSKEALETIKPLLETDYLKVFTTNDVRGVELCSILKNIYSIAVGVVYGMGLGDNVRGLIVYYAINEMKQIISLYGGKINTLFSPAGLSDFIITAFSNKSRNRTIGSLLGLGIIKNKQFKTGILAEGLKSISTIKRFSDEKGLSTPVLNFVNDICFKEITPFQALSNLEIKFFCNRPIGKKNSNQVISLEDCNFS